MQCPGMRTPEPGTKKQDWRGGGKFQWSKCRMSIYEEVHERIGTRPWTRLVTGVADGVQP